MEELGVEEARRENGAGSEGGTEDGRRDGERHWHIMLFILPAKFVLAVFLPLIIITDIWVIYIWRKFPIYKILFIMCLGGIIGQILGWMVFDYFNDKTIVLAIAILAIVTSLRYFKNLYFEQKYDIKYYNSKLMIKKGISWCSLSGFSSFIALTGGIPAQIFITIKARKREVCCYNGFLFLFYKFYENSIFS